MKILIKNNQKIKKIKSVNYREEKAIQNLIYENPDIIPVEEIEDRIKTIEVAREFGIPNSGSTDLIGIDNNANIYIIECKLAYNPQIKREVIGQILEYASFLWHMTYEDFSNRFRKSKGSAIEYLFESIFNDESAIDKFIAKIKENLSNGNFKLIIVVDKLNDLLKNTLEFINYSSSNNIQLIGLEVSYFKENELEIFVPNIFGANVINPSVRIMWDEEKFLTEISSLDENKREILIELISFIKGKATTYSWGTGTVDGSLTFKMNYNDIIVSLFSIYTSGKITFSFNDIEKKMGLENLKKYINYLNTLKYLNLKESDCIGFKCPYFDLNRIAKNIEDLKRFKEIIINFTKLLN